MNPIRAYIYGVPDGFNLLSGTAREIEYYQRFYNTQRTGEDLLIDRRGNGECIYSYLRYGLVSSKGREGAFFGLSLVFTAGDYLKDVHKLRELFTLIYEQLVLGDDKLIRPMPNAAGCYRISKFADEEALCAKIERNLIANVERSFATSVETWAYPSDKAKVGRLLPLPLDADRALLERAFAEGYTQLRLSSSFEPAVSKEGQKQIQDLLSPEWIEERSKGVSRYKDFIIQMLKGAMPIERVRHEQEEIKQDLYILERYQRFQPELVELVREYNKLEGELSEYIRAKPSIAMSTPPSSTAATPEPIDIVTHLGILSRHKLMLPGVALVVLLGLGLTAYYFMGKNSSAPKEVSTNVIPTPAETGMVGEPKEDSREQVFNEAISQIRRYIENREYIGAEARIRNLERDYPESHYKPRIGNLTLELKAQFEKEIIGAEGWTKKQLDDKIAWLEAITRQTAYLGDLADIQLKTLNVHLAKQTKIETGIINNATDKSKKRKGLYKADDKYQAVDAKPLGTTVKCTTKSCYFVFYGSPLPEGREADGVEVVHNGEGVARIRVTRSGAITLKMGGKTYTFHVSR